MSPALPLFLAVALGAEARVETGIRTEARYRRLDPAPTPAQRDAVDLSATPHLTLGVTGGLGSISATYAPRLTAADVGPDLRWEHMHEGELRLRLSPDPTWSLQGFAEGGTGKTDLITENRTAGAGTGVGTGTNTISTVSRVDLERERAGLALRLAPDRRLEVLLSGAAFQDGGTNRESRTVLPFARGAEAGAEVRWDATRLDQLGVRLAAAETRIGALRTDSAWASALATWRRRLDPQTLFRAGAGAVELRSRVPRAPPSTGRETQTRTSPAGELGISRTARDRQEVVPGQDPTGTQTTTRRPGLDPTGQLVATLGASVDRLTGAAAPELDLLAELRWPLSASVATIGRGTGALTWPDSGRTRRGQLELGASLQLDPRALVEMGGYAAWQNSQDTNVPDLAEYGAFLRLALDAPPLTH